MYDVFAIPVDVFNSLDEEFKRPVSLHIFKTMVYDNDIDEAIKKHKIEIVTAIIYSKSNLHITTNLLSMSGFLEQYGRMPTSNDKIKIIKGMYYFDVRGDYIISEIGYQVL